MTDDFCQIFDKLASARPFGKAVHQPRLFAQAMKLMRSPAGVTALYGMAPQFGEAGVFAGGDWDYPASLQPDLVRETLFEGGPNATVECLSELRMLAIASGIVQHPDLSSAEARDFLEQVLARNLDILFPAATETTREERGVLLAVRNLFAFIVEHIGTASIFSALVEECERMTLQRRIMVKRIEQMIASMARALQAEGEIAEDQEDLVQARWMVDALYGPTALTQLHRNPASYHAALAALDSDALAAEAAALGERMDETGLVCPQHAALLLYLSQDRPELIPAALALNRVGCVGYEEFDELVRRMINSAVTAETARCVYGLSRMLNRGSLFFAPVPTGLQRIMALPILPDVAQQLLRTGDWAKPPDPNGLLLAGTLSVIGQPRGVDQGHNPTCQAARAISLWSQNDVGYLLELIAEAASEGNILMHFEGHPIHSGDLSPGLAPELNPELDPVSLLLTPHLDRIYMEMSRRTIGRDQDGHKWVNPEFHGWWVDRDFASLIDAATEAIAGLEGFMRLFYASYHPLYNGGRKVVYAQPCGVVSTNAHGNFVGWHAVSIQRVDRDPDGVWRVYFFNPNRDKGQDWGQGIVTETHDHGEYEGESSLPFEQFAMRLYVFHYRHGETGDPALVPAEDIEAIRDIVAAGWGEAFHWLTDGEVEA